MKKIILPEDIAPFVEIENCSNFPINRYYVTKDQDAILKDILRMKKIVTELKKINIDYLNATLLYGPTGTGKTSLGKYISYCLGLEFAYVNFAKLVDGIFGNTARNISKVFRYMANVECVFMLDEIDCISQKRGTEGSATGGELSRITITLMQELDHYKSQRVESILLAATNRKDIMDDALLSRFPIKKKLRALTNPEKEAFICKYLDDVGIVYSLDNIQDYCVKNSNIKNRNIEADMNRCIATWIEQGKKKFMLSSINEEECL